uniref:Ethanolamine utilization protein EutP n=1 Tax=Bellilinea caldifistulae TaxID=360411 RepID=A0A7C4Q3D9_9CHLR
MKNRTFSSLQKMDSDTAHTWPFMLFGGKSSGKTALLLALEGKNPSPAARSKGIDYSGWGIDISGEYCESGKLRRELVTAALKAKLLIVVQDATSDRMVFPPHYFLMYPHPKIGVVTKMDLPDADPQRAAGLLRAAGVDGKIFYVSVFSGEGISGLRDFLLKQDF